MNHSVSGVALLACLPFNLVFSSLSFANDETEILVTANRISETVDESLASVTLINRQDIEAQQPNDLIDLLRNVPGIDVSRTGGAGAATSLFLRGSNSDHVLVLVDGVRASSATTGSFSWEHLQPSQIERIEIVRGPRAALYGSDAIGGVIQIFTRKNTGFSAKVGAGSFARGQINVNAGGQYEAINYSLNVAQDKTDGFSATNDKHGSFDDDKDGYENTSLSGKLEIVFGENSELKFGAWRSKGEREYDTGVLDSVNETLHVQLRQDLNDFWSHTLSVGNAKDEQENVSPSFESRFDTERNSFDWQNDFAIDDETLVSVGFNYYQDEGDTSAYVEDIDNSGVFAQIHQQRQQFDWSLATRQDDHSKFGKETTGQVSAGYAFTPATRVVLSHGTAFKAPSLNQLFYPFFGDENLEPEKSESTEISLRQKISSEQSIRLTLFKTAIDNLIESDPNTFLAANIAEVEINGLEAEYIARWSSFSFNAAYTLQEAIDKESDERLLRRPDRKLSMSLEHQVSEQFQYGVETLLSSERDDLNFSSFPAERIALDEYGLANLYSRYHFAKNLIVSARLDNLFDADYEYAYGFNNPERSIFVSLDYRFE